MTSLFIILFMFIHNSSSKNSRKTTAPKLFTHRFSAGCVSEFLQFSVSARFPGTNFDTNLVDFFLKLVLPIILKEIRSIFVISTFNYVYSQHCDNHFLVYGVYSCSHSFPSKYLPAKQTDAIQNSNKKHVAIYLKADMQRLIWRKKN